MDSEDLDLESSRLGFSMRVLAVRATLRALVVGEVDEFVVLVAMLAFVEAAVVVVSNRCGPEVKGS